MSMDTVLAVYKQIGHPMASGTFHSYGVFRPDKNERCSCCDLVRPPSRGHACTLLNHCYTRRHLKTRLIEHPSPVEIKAMEMTKKTAPLFINDPDELLKRVAQHFFMSV